jgi:hypothetical protein
MRLRIDPDTQQALTFLVGLFGIIGQFALSALGIPPSLPLLSIFGVMIGLGVAPTLLAGRDGRGPGGPKGEGGEERKGADRHAD